MGGVACIVDSKGLGERGLQLGSMPVAEQAALLGSCCLLCWLHLCLQQNFLAHQVLAVPFASTS